MQKFRTAFWFLSITIILTASTLRALPMVEEMEVVRSIVSEGALIQNTTMELRTTEPTRVTIEPGSPTASSRVQAQIITNRPITGALTSHTSIEEVNAFPAVPTTPLQIIPHQENLLVTDATASSSTSSSDSLAGAGKGRSLDVLKMPEVEAKESSFYPEVPAIHTTLEPSAPPLKEQGNVMNDAVALSVLPASINSEQLVVAQKVTDDHAPLNSHECYEFNHLYDEVPPAVPLEPGEEIEDVSSSEWGILEWVDALPIPSCPPDEEGVILPAHPATIQEFILHLAQAMERALRDNGLPVSLLQESKKLLVKWFAAYFEDRRDELADAFNKLCEEINLQQDNLEGREHFRLQLLAASKQVEAPFYSPREFYRIKNIQENQRQQQAYQEYKEQVNITLRDLGNSYDKIMRQIEFLFFSPERMELIDGYYGSKGCSCLEFSYEQVMNMAKRAANPRYLKDDKSKRVTAELQSKVLIMIHLALALKLTRDTAPPLHSDPVGSYDRSKKTQDAISSIVELLKAVEKPRQLGKNEDRRIIRQTAIFRSIVDYIKYGKAVQQGDYSKAEQYIQRANVWKNHALNGAAAPLVTSWDL